MAASVLVIERIVEQYATFADRRVLGDERDLSQVSSALVSIDDAKGKLKNSVGAGDSMVAGFVYGYLKSNDYKQAFIYGVCTGSASAFSEELATKPEVEALIDKLDSASN